MYGMGILDHMLENYFLAGEVIINPAQCDFRVICDSAYRDPMVMVAMLGEKILRCQQDLLPCFFAFAKGRIQYRLHYERTFVPNEKK